MLRELYSAQVSAAQLPWTPLRGRLLLYDRHHTTWAPSSAPRCQLLLVAFHHPTTTIPHQTPQHMLLRELYSAQVSAAQLPWTPLRGRLLLYDRHHTTWAPSSAPRCQLLLVAFHHSTPMSQTSQHLLQLVLRELIHAQVSAAQLPLALPMERLLLYVHHPNPWAPSFAPSCLL